MLIRTGWSPIITAIQFDPLVVLLIVTAQTDDVLGADIPAWQAVKRGRIARLVELAATGAWFGVQDAEIQVRIRRGQRRLVAVGCTLATGAGQQQADEGR
ncbi:MAG: hypothetical protein JF591_08995 [Lysobacter sp.]|nr:hypothetical protein [Lysobacter sp.]